LAGVHTVEGHAKGGGLHTLLGDLDPKQQEAVLHGDEPLLIIAGAGTGKTTTLAHRVAHLITGGVNPARILLLTFSRRAASEMLRRADSALRRAEAAARAGGAPTNGGAERPPPMASIPAGSRVWGGTFHATAARLLRIHGRDIGLDPGFTIIDRADSEDLMGAVRTRLGLSRNDRRFPQKSTCLDIYSHCVNTRHPLEKALRTHFPWCAEHADELRRLFSGYVDRKAEGSVLDYDDLLVFWCGLLSDPAAGAAVRARFDRVLVDEYQDTNALQAEILALLRPDGRGLTVVGDDAQSIYAFRGATVRNILDFPTQFQGTEVITLDQNFRSTPAILDVTNRVIAQARERYEKDLWSRRPTGERPNLVTCCDEDEQTRFVVTRILEHREQGVPLRKMAVLFRAAHHSLTLEMELGRRNIPYHKYGGLKFMETAHVKDLVAFLRLAENPRDEMAGLRVLQLLPGVGPRRAAEFLGLLREAPGALSSSDVDSTEAPGDGSDAAGIPAPDVSRSDPAPSPGPFAAWHQVRPPEAAAALWPGLVRLMDGLSVADPGPPSVQVERVHAFYRPIAEGLYDSPESRLADLEALARLAVRTPDRARFLADMALDPPSWTGDLAGPPVLDEDYLILSTMHSAKGLEWDAVFVIHAADGNIPSDMSTGSAEEIDEERRLFYVALTRARDYLYVCCPFRYHTVPRRPADPFGYAQVSRFLSPDVRSVMGFETAEALLAHDTDGGTGEGRLAADRAGCVTVADIRAAIKSSW